MPIPSDPIVLSDILKSRLWRYLQNFANYNFQTTMFQPVGGMDMIGKAFAKEVGDVIRYNAKVTRHSSRTMAASPSLIVDTATAARRCNRPPQTGASAPFRSRS